MGWGVFLTAEPNTPASDYTEKDSVPGSGNGPPSIFRRRKYLKAIIPEAAMDDDSDEYASSMQKT